MKEAQERIKKQLLISYYVTRNPDIIFLLARL